VKGLVLADKGRLRIESTGGSFPAVCRKFVIPAEAGIQRARLDSPVSSTGQACQARNDGSEQNTSQLAAGYFISSDRIIPHGGLV
jgi:hypothetical protein